MPDCEVVNTGWGGKRRSGLLKVTGFYRIENIVQLRADIEKIEIFKSIPSLLFEA